MIFTNAFALNAVLTPAFAISFLLIIHFLLRHNSKVFEGPPFLFLFWLLLTFSFLAMSNSEKSINHWFLWTFPFFSYYFVFKNELAYLFSLDEIKDKILKYISYATLFACSFSILEFCFVNYLEFDLSFIPRGVVEDYNPIDLGFTRARSFTEESGHFSFFVEIFGPLAVCRIKNYKNVLLKTIALVTILLGLIATMSGVGLLLLSVYLTLFFNFYFFKKRISNLSRLRLFFYALGLLIPVIVIYPNFFPSLLDLVVFKIDPENLSYFDRMSRFSAVEKLSGVSYLIGYGPAAFSTLKVDSFISLYLGILMNTGIIGVILFTLFCWSKYSMIKKIKDIDIRFALKCSLLFAFVHLAFIDIIYVPWFWVLLSLIDIIYRKEKYKLAHI